MGGRREGGNRRATCNQGVTYWGDAVAPGTLYPRGMQFHSLIRHVRWAEGANGVGGHPLKGGNLTVLVRMLHGFSSLLWVTEDEEGRGSWRREQMLVIDSVSRLDTKGSLSLVRVVGGPTKDETYWTLPIHISFFV